MAEENKKGGFWASLFGRNKKQDEPKIEPIIEEEKIKDIEPSIEKFEANDLVEEEKIQEISTALEPIEELLPTARCALTAPFHPYRLHGGLLSVALVVGSRRPDVIRHSALCSSDFPLVYLSH